MRIQREGAQLQIRGTWSAGPGDDQARFLADLRALRDSAAIGYDELAARAHYPSDVLKEAENGPCLPGLPILAAYVRACEGDVLDWEERWRRLNPEVADDPDLPVRPAGASPAAVAGARAGVGVGAPDVYDPERIRAALRGDHERSGQDSRRANDQGISALARPRGELRSGPAHGFRREPGQRRELGGQRELGHARRPEHHLGQREPPGQARQPRAVRRRVHRPAGSRRAHRTRSGPGLLLARQQPTGIPARRTGRPRLRVAGAGGRWSGGAAGGRAGTGARRHRTDTAASGRRPDVTGTDGFLGQASATGTDGFLGQAAASPSAPADLQPPAPTPRAEEPAITPAPWPASADTATTSAAEPAQRAATDVARGAAAAAQPLSSAGSAAQATGSQRDDRRKDRFFPVRLLAVIVIAALIGSALVLLLK